VQPGGPADDICNRDGERRIWGRLLDRGRETFDVRRSTFGVRRSAFGVRGSRFEVRRGTVDF
jgi:hypothetical protein